MYVHLSSVLEINVAPGGTVSQAPMKRKGRITVIIQSSILTVHRSHYDFHSQLSPLWASAALNTSRLVKWSERTTSAYIGLERCKVREVSMTTCFRTGEIYGEVQVGRLSSVSTDALTLPETARVQLERPISPRSKPEPNKLLEGNNLRFEYGLLMVSYSLNKMKSLA
ncbi:hypothetical protein RRG08_008104 [Elysia crispata]|uniref:Uncharacterized protein n=1 Tax=Elysia crispata TaxID=231223 RepID=A0AAE1CW86_9GAST|nr:hypothetical protein RRG08_008104 [Elysia crispata]